VVDTLGTSGACTWVKAPTLVCNPACPVNQTCGAGDVCVYRGPGEVAEFDPPQVKPWEDTRPFANSPWASQWKSPEIPEDGRWVSEVKISQPGTYVIRGRADDGGLYSDVEVTVRVSPAVS
jgi:hypothetical protein